jgi:beta-lactam-binding protein with PASTA domain
VPKLKALSLTQAKRRLAAAHCRLGKVTKPRHPKGRLIVSRQGGQAGLSLKPGASVSVTLTVKPPAHKRADHSVRAPNG